MRKAACVVSLSTAVLLGGFGMGGCGSVSPADTGDARVAAAIRAARPEPRARPAVRGTTGAGGGGAGTSGSAGTGGGAAADRGGSSAGRRGNDRRRRDRWGAAGRGGSDGAGTGGRGGGTAGTTGAGGVATGGRGGSGTAGTTGAGGGTGGVALGGRGGNNNVGVAGTTGTVGTGGVASGGRGGTTGAAGTGGATTSCPAGGCPPLMIGDLQAIDDSGAPGFDAAMFRCMALTICQNSSSCVYFATDMLGSAQSADDVYNDGAELTPAAVKLSISTGAQSQCVNPSVTFTESQYIVLTFDGGKQLKVYLPMFMGNSLTLYIATDGSTFRDARADDARAPAALSCAGSWAVGQLGSWDCQAGT